MNLYKIEQDEVRGYDTYSDAVVCAESPEDAARIHPSTCRRWNTYLCEWVADFRDPLDPERPPGMWVERMGSGNLFPHDAVDWATHPDRVRATLIGEAVPGLPRGVVCASFHAS